MTTRKPAARPARDEPDGHWPVWRIVPGISPSIPVIGCQCGANPTKRSARNSTQHVWHQTHRRGLKLCPVDYEWPDESYHVDGALSTGNYWRVRGHVWRDGGWQPA